MFKRVAKRVKRQEEEEALGLDEDMKEALGMQDTDSEESDSDSDSNGESDEEVEGSQASMDGISKGDADEGMDSESEVDRDEAEGEEDAESETSEVLNAPMNLEEALRDPVHLISLDPEVKECIVCPGKLLKNTKMVEVHVSANAHKRRMVKFVRLAKGQEDIVDVLRMFKSELESAPKPKPKPAAAKTDDLSKRALRRKAKMDQVKVKRARQKEMKAKAFKKKAASASTTDAADEAEQVPSPSSKKKSVVKPNPKLSKVNNTLSEQTSASTFSPAAKVKKPKKATKPDVPMPVPSADAPSTKKRRKAEDESNKLMTTDEVPSKLAAQATLPRPSKKAKTTKEVTIVDQDILQRKKSDSKPQRDRKKSKKSM